MTFLQIMSATDSSAIAVRTMDRAVIGAELSRRGVFFEQWPVPAGVVATSPADDILAAFADRVAELSGAGGYRFVDIARIHPAPDPESSAAAGAARAKFRDEHRHTEDEVRFFVLGRGCFYLRVDNQVCAIACAAGDLISIPAGTAHWFDMGVDPEFIAIRFFKESDGWIGDFTGDTISSRFPTLDELCDANQVCGTHPVRTA